MQYVLTRRQAKVFLTLGVAICVLSIVASSSSLWAGWQWRRERRAYERATALVEEALATAAKLMGEETP